MATGVAALFVEGLMSMFGACPVCGSFQWESIERDGNGINRTVRCLDCGVQRDRKYEPLESWPIRDDGEVIQ